MGQLVPPFGVIGADGHDLPRALIRRRVVAAEKGSDHLEHPAMMLGQTITMPQRMIQPDLVLRGGRQNGQPVIREGKRGVELGGPPKGYLGLGSSRPELALALEIGLECRQ